MSRRFWYREMLPIVAMVARQCFNTSVKILFNLKGMSFYVYITYTFVLVNLGILPFVFIFPSSAVLPSSKFPLISRICFLGSLVFITLLLGFKGIEYSSPTLSYALINIVPVFTFILAFIFRMERVALRRLSSQAKIIGTIVSVSGALMVLLHKGPTVFSLASLPSDWLIGGLLLTAEYLLFSFWFIVLTQVMKIYPAKFTMILLFNLCATIICIPVCLIAEPNLSRWILNSSGEITAVLYSGFASVAALIMETWCLHLKGPVYVTSFNPLSSPIAAAMSAMFLGDALQLGSVIEAIITFIGFYAVLWGKAKEEGTSDDSELLVTITSEDQVPLLLGIDLDK